jgi:hypothetical protein
MYFNPEKQQIPRPGGIVNELLHMLFTEIQETIHMLFIIMWATGFTPKAWEISNTILLDKTKEMKRRHLPIAQLAWQIPSTNYGRVSSQTLYEYAGANSILSTTQAGFCKQKDPIHQLAKVIMALEDAKLFHKDIYALIVDFTSAFNTTDHDPML